jgi:hypothetical protein
MFCQVYNTNTLTAVVKYPVRGITRSLWFVNTAFTILLAAYSGDRVGNNMSNLNKNNQNAI